MHLLFDARLLHRPLSGLERVQRNLLRELGGMPEVRRLRVLVTAGTRLPPCFPTRAEAIEVHATEDILQLLLAADPAERPDVYHLSWFPDQMPRDLWLPLAARASVVEVHDAILNRHPEYHRDHKAWAWYHAFVHALVRNGDRLLCHSRSVQQEIERDLGGDASLADLAPLAVDPELCTPLPAAEVALRLQRLGITGDYFVAVGKDYPHKDHATLYAALAALPSSVHVVCVGTQVWQGPDAAREQLAKLGVLGRVRWIADLDDHDAKAVLQGSRALVYPSREEGFGLPPIEAMALSVPVVAAAAMSIPEVCGDGAWLFAPGDARQLRALLQQVLAGGPALAALVQRGRAQQAQYSWRRCAEQTVACYRAAIESARGPRVRPVLDPQLLRTLEVIASSPSRAERELAAWQERCLSVEHTLTLVRAQLAAATGVPVPVPAPVVPRPRFSLKRRLQKIRDGLSKRRVPGGEP